MTEHVLDMDVRFVRISYAGASIMSHQEYAWFCSCGLRGNWEMKALSARRGGEQHRAKMEK